MKFVHIADTHLGASAYRKRSESGYNQREEDIANAFEAAVDKILEIKPDFVLHAGDLFDSARPTNRMIHFALEQVLRIAKEVPFIIISGNHDTPKQLYTGSVFKIFEVMPVNDGRLHVIYKNKYTPVELETPGGKVTIHAVPQCTEDRIFRDQLNAVKKVEGQKNILMLHGGVIGMREFAHGDFNELLVDAKYFDENEFDYVALGHYHNFANVGRNAWFSGSTERLSFNEAGTQKGIAVVNLSSEPKVELHPTPTREMIELPAVNAIGKDSLALSEEIEKRLSSVDSNGKIIRMKIEKVPAHILSTLDMKKFKEMMGSATHFEPIFEKVDEKGSLEPIKTSIGGLNEEYNSFIESYPNMKKDDRERFKRLGQKYLNLVLEGEK
jgi:DNA repair exonuclease SbcCD nuclease subunit